ncbi:MAG: M20/M25/M40 family metallo-hydrolase [Desulfobacteraceae bacterium]|nr:M20/M25/M40 family metallo-hydrolase [Desulfobacteraceae bacterium]MBC2756715.1 M20/M25/M40 family metallo-hydrolase [Desulfobacteraceae bacterium]
MPSADTAADYHHPEKILQKLIRFDTTNPPGNEKACIDYIADLLKQNGIESVLIAKDPGRPNLIARLNGSNYAPPLLMYGHADVVTTENQIWRHPPFEGKITDGFVWGRGALDMKGAVAMMAAALLRAKAENLKPAGDIVFAVLSDEESGGNLGARYLVENYPEQFSGIHYAIGEFGACAMYVGQQKFYPIQVSEKQICWIEAKIKGPGGHGSFPLKNSAMSKMGQFINKISSSNLSPHITAIPRQMVQTIASAMPMPAGLILRQLLNPVLTEKVLKLLGPKGDKFKPMLFNTVNPTVVKGGSKINVIPSEISLQLDCRLLPGFTPEDLIAELRPATGTDISIDIISYDHCPANPDLGMFSLLADVLREADPEGIPMQMLLPGATDGRFFSRLNIQTYGFTPMNLSPGFDFFSTIHAANERVPIDAIHFGANTIFRLLQRYGESVISAKKG